MVFALVFLFSLCAGAKWISPFNLSGGDAFLLFSIRLPRVLMATSVGALLGLSGAVYQMVLRNPLADGFTVGAASSCALGAVFAISFGAPLFMVGFSALVFGLLGFSVVYFLSMRGDFVEPVTMVLAGIVVNIIASSAMSFLKFLKEESVLSVVFWMMGFISFVGWKKVLCEVVVLILVLLAVFRKAGALDVLCFDEASAFSTGVDVAAMRRYFFFWATLMVAFSVAFTGVIAFVGLIVPHVARALVGADAKRVLISSCYGGALLLLLSDALSRSILIGGGELPVGIITSFCGGGFFLYLLMKRRSYWHV